MSVTKNEIKYIAELAHLEFCDSEIVQMQDDMNALIKLADALSSFDESGTDEQSSENNLRPDVPKKEYDKSSLMKNTSEREGDFFTAPKVID